MAPKYPGLKRSNHKAWDPLLEKYPLVHTFQYKKDRKGQIARLVHIFDFGDVHDPELVDQEFRNFFSEVGFTYHGMEKHIFGYQGYGGLDR